MAKAKTFEERFSRFKGKWDLQPTSYQLRKPDGSAGGWIAQVRVWQNLVDQQIVTPLMEKEPKVYGTVEEANTVGLWLGLNWLERHEV